MAQLVASVTDDQEMVAAAWLHDTVEDTQATIEDIEREFGRSPLTLVESVVPHEIYLSNESMLDAGVTAEDVGAWLETYRYGDNIGPYVPADAIDRDRLDRRIFAGVMPARFIEELAGADLSRYGEGEFGMAPGVDPGIPPVTW